MIFFFFFNFIKVDPFDELFMVLPVVPQGF